MQAWGTHLRIEAPDSASVDDFLTRWRKLLATWERPLDPDCRWQKTPPCQRLETLPAELSDLLASVERETQGYFQVHLPAPGPGSAAARDLGGISQGFLLDQFRREVSKSADLRLDFGSDVFVSGSKAREWVWGDPLFQKLPMAAISLRQGWVFVSASRATGAKLRNPKVIGDKAWTEDFDAVLLVAGPEMSGARLDAWATALMVGGESLLKHLWKLKEFEGKWDYAYLKGASSKLTCSPRLICKKNPDSAPTRWTIRTPY